MIIESSDENTPIQAKILVTGIVQGVGFRPFVFRLASDLGLTGTVCNMGETVEIELLTNKSNFTRFISRLQSEAPPVSRIDHIEIIEAFEVSDFELKGKFEIKQSGSQAGNGNVDIPPDIATCENCLAEMFDNSDRRYQYAFLNCTNCGPRFTVIEGLPYDREATSMACFPMCQNCEIEYSDPLNRRFHAQPIACRVCGPALMFFDPKTQDSDSNCFFEDYSNQPLEDALAFLCAGKIVAIKGLGGFHLVCDATNGDAVALLRRRKGRLAKPFAIMVPSIQYLERICHVSKQELQILQGRFRPIVLLKKLFEKDGFVSSDSKNSLEFIPPLAAEVAPQLLSLGVMLPYTPLHHLLLANFGKPLIMTSANFSETPIVADNREALERLSTIADAFLFHNRDIVSRYDDTVSRVINGEETLVRRARGYAPGAIRLAFRAKVPVLAMGGHLKNTFCLIKDDKAYVSQHIGDLDTLESIEHFENTLRSYLELFNISPEILAIDMHPDYGSTKLAQAWMSEPCNVPLKTDRIQHVVSVQHHHAHIASCMAENRINEPVIGVAFDGIGYGADNNLWGGEFFHCGFDSFNRMARFKYISMPGGVSAIRDPWRMALSYMAFCSPRIKELKVVEQILERFSAVYGKSNVQAIYTRLAFSDLGVKTSSCGRLFDAVSAILGVCEIAHYEGQAAIELECFASHCASDCEPARAYPFKHYSASSGEQEIIEIDPNSIFEGVLEDISNGTEKHLIAAKFHETIARVILEICQVLRSKCGTNIICLSGGVFQNERLLSRARELLKNNDFVMFMNRQVPANDGGISLGQAAIALAKANMLEVSI